MAEITLAESFSKGSAIKFVDPETIVEKLEVAPGSIVADFGCGAGYFSIAFAKRLKETGTVYALDILKSSLESVAGEAKNLGLTNIVTSRVNLESIGGSKLGDNTINWVVMKDMLFQNKDKVTILKEATRVLAPQGKALVIEWNPQDSALGPDEELRIAKEKVVNLAQEAGLTFTNDLTVGNFHYGLIFQK